MNSKYLATLFAALVMLAAAPAAAQVPDTLPVQGYLTDSEDVPIDGTTTVTFRLYDSASGGSALWSETRDLQVTNGQFSVYLGTQTPVDASLFTGGGDRYLGVTVDDGEELSPRFSLGSVPYAQVAEFAAAADTLQGLTPDDFARAGDVGWDELADVPGAVSDIAALNCAADQFAVYDGSAWSCADAPSDTLASLNCATDDVAAWDGSAWICSPRDADYSAVASSGSYNDLTDVPTDLVDGDDDTLAGLSCGTDEVAAWDGSAWACAARDDTYAAVASSGAFTDLNGIPSGLADGDDDMLAGLSCAAGQVAAWDGAAWVCSARDATYAAVATSGSFNDLTDVPAGLADGDDDTLAGLSCATDEVAAWDGSAWACAARDDTYAAVASTGAFSDLSGVPTGLADGDDDALGALTCSAGEVAAWNGTTASWECAARDQTYAAVATSGDFADLKNVPAGLADGDDDTLAGLSCASAEVAKWTGTTWACAADIDTDTTLDEATVDSFVANNGYITQADADARYVQEDQVDAITSAMIADGEILDADVAAGAAIAPSKIDGTAATLTGDQNFDNGTLQIDAANDRVGVGAAPTSKLEVAGTAKADEFGYRTRKTSYEFVDGMQFRRHSNAMHSIQPDGTIFFETGFYYFYAAVDVPHGSRMDEITCFAPGGNILDWELKARAHNSTSATVLASGDNTNRSASLTEVVDLSAYSYFIRIRMVANPFSGCRITYSTDRVLP